MTAATLRELPLPVQIVDPIRSPIDFRFSFDTVRDFSYVAQYTDSLSTPDWTSFAILAGNGSRLTVTNEIPSGSARFFRVVAD